MLLVGRAHVLATDTVKLGRVALLAWGVADTSLTASGQLSSFVLVRFAKAKRVLHWATGFPAASRLAWPSV